MNRCLAIFHLRTYTIGFFSFLIKPLPFAWPHIIIFANKFTDMWAKICGLFRKAFLNDLDWRNFGVKLRVLGQFFIFTHNFFLCRHCSCWRKNFCSIIRHCIDISLENCWGWFSFDIINFCLKIEIRVFFWNKITFFSAGALGLNSSFNNVSLEQDASLLICY